MKLRTCSVALGATMLVAPFAFALPAAGQEAPRPAEGPPAQPPTTAAQPFPADLARPRVRLPKCAIDDVKPSLRELAGGRSAVRVDAPDTTTSALKTAVTARPPARPMWA